VAAILAHYGYDALLAVQPAGTANGMKVAVSLIASTPFLLCIVLLFFYEIKKPVELQIEKDLGARRALQAATPA
jgi:GPH family glycoside/pentoside/hexuronide:cation symporter